MKLVLVASLLAGLAGLAHADTYSGPPGGGADEVYQPVAQHQPPPQQQRGELHRAMLDRFDRNHDGRLEPRERAQAARALRRMANRLDRGAARAQRQQQRAERRAERQQQRQQRRQPQAQGPNVDVYVE